MLSETYPKVTIVSANPLRNDGCNGIMMRSLFSGWPRERLSQVYFRVAVPHLPNVDDCSQYRVIDITSRARRVFPAATDRPNADENSTGPAPRADHRKRLVRLLSRQRGVFGYLRSAHEFWSAQPWFYRALERQLRALRPDVVYTLLGNYSLTKVATRACQRLGIPVFAHVVDDFVRAVYQEVPLARKLQARSEFWFRRAVAGADGLAAISSVMGEEYERRYQRPWSWFTTLIDADAYNPSPRPEDGTFRLAYTGSLTLGRWQSLRSVALALKDLHDQQGIETRLLIYSSPEQLKEHRRALEIPPITELCGWSPPEQLPRVFHNADVLVHVESFESSIADFTKLSFSTKLSQYMMSGRAILAFGPEHLGSIRVLRDAGAAVVVCEKDPTALTQDLRQLLTRSELRQQCGRSGRRWAVQHVERRSGHERFRQELLAALRRSRLRQHPRAAA